MQHRLGTLPSPEGNSPTRYNRDPLPVVPLTTLHTSSPFSAPHVPRELYYESPEMQKKKKKSTDPWPKKKVWPEAQMKDIPFRPPNPASEMVSHLKSHIKELKEVLPDEQPFDVKENYVGYSLTTSLDGYAERQERGMLSEREDTNGNKQRVPATEMALIWMPEPGETLHETTKEGPIRDGNVVRHCAFSEFSKRSKEEIEGMDPFELAQLYKYIRYREDGITIAEADLEMRREALGRTLLTSYATETRALCERCTPTPATSTRPNPFRYLSAKTTRLCGAKPGQDHIWGGEGKGSPSIRKNNGLSDPKNGSEEEGVFSHTLNDNEAPPVRRPFPINAFP